DLSIQLVIFGPGDEIFTWWGHNAMIVKDHGQDVLRIYNFGLYSFGDGMLAKFVMGRLIFFGGAFKSMNYLNYYINENRDVRIIELKLPPEKRLTLARRLGEAVLPVNKHYLYHHYYENCSTRLRDMIDDALDGALSEKASQPARMTLRQHTRRYVGHSPMMEMLLMYLMNDDIDQPITEWNEMFLPDELERQVRELQYTTSDGDTIKLAQSTNIVHAADREAIPETVYLHWPGALLIGLIVGGAAWFLVYWRVNNPNRFSPRAGLSFYHIFIGIIFGIPGLGLTLVASFTDHQVAYYNENLLMINLLTFLFLPLGFLTIWKRVWAERWLDTLWLIHGLGAVLAVVLKVFPSFDQSNGLVMALVLPVICMNGVSRLWIKRQT
ncbi:MAG: DUF4105 domain-containing protein, partial [Caldithrix sp.]|nr:DUF4105 domain-containing protein [Caldithrix sp.]